MSCPARALVDVNVFVATWTLDVVLTLADRGMVEPCWSEDVLGEARDAVNRVHGTRGGARYIAAAERAFPYATVELEKSDLENIELPDPDDCPRGRRRARGRLRRHRDVQREGLPRRGALAAGAARSSARRLPYGGRRRRLRWAVAAVRSVVAAKKYPPRTIEEELEGLRINMLDRLPTSSSGRLGRADGSSASWGQSRRPLELQAQPLSEIFAQRRKNFR